MTQIVRTHADRDIALEVLANKPKICYFCRKSTGGKWVTHHINGDFKDNREENLAWAHKSCHSSKHNEGHKVSQKTIDALIKRNKERVWTGDMRKKLADAHRGKKLSLETRLKMADAHRGRKIPQRKTSRRKLSCVFTEEEKKQKHREDVRLWKQMHPEAVREQKRRAYCRKHP